MRCAVKLLSCQCPKIGSPFISSLGRREERLCKGEDLPSNYNNSKKFGFSADAQGTKNSKQVQKTSVSSRMLGSRYHWMNSELIFGGTAGTGGRVKILSTA